MLDMTLLHILIHAGPVVLCYKWCVGPRKDAMSLEKRVKACSRQVKELIISRPTSPPYGEDIPKFTHANDYLGLGMSWKQACKRLSKAEIAWAQRRWWTETQEGCQKFHKLSEEDRERKRNGWESELRDADTASLEAKVRSLLSDHQTP